MKQVLYVDIAAPMGAGKQLVVLQWLPENVAREKSRLAEVIRTGVQQLTDKYHGMPDFRSREWKKYWCEFSRIIDPVFEEYHSLTPAGTATDKVVFEKTSYKRGDILDYIVS